MKTLEPTRIGRPFAAVSELLPALLFLTLYLLPTLVSSGVMRAMRATALLQLFFTWAAMGAAALIFVRTDSNPRSTRLRLLTVAGGFGVLLVAGAFTGAVMPLPLVLMTAPILINLWYAAQEGQAALRIERTLGIAMLPCLVLAVLLTSVIKPLFDHTICTPELLTAGLLYLELAALRGWLRRRAGRRPPARVGRSLPRA